MKIILIALIAFSQLLTTSLIAKEVPAKKPADVEITINIKGEIGKKSRGCKGIGLSCLHLELDIDIVRFGKAALGSTIINFETLPNNQLKMTFFSNNDGDMEIESDLTLGSKISKLLGYSDVVVLKGNYKTTKRSDGAYVVVVNTKRN